MHLGQLEQKDGIGDIVELLPQLSNKLALCTMD